MDTNNPTVNCKTGGIHFNLCHNCIIQGIIWNGCGSETKAGAALMLNNSSQITIRNCSFQHSSGQVIVLSEVSAEININYCNFSKNNQYKGHGTSIHAVAAGSSNFTLNMNNCNFNYNTYAKSLVYIRSIEHNAITLYDSTFNSNIGVSIFLINQVLLLKGNVLFQSNRAENGAAIYISNHSRVIFGEDSDVAFIQNSADNAGGAIFLNNHSSLLFSQSTRVIFCSNSAKDYGAAINSLNSSHIIFTGSSNTIFSNNRAGYGGGISSYNGKISFELSANSTFSNNTGDYGGAIYANFDTYIYFKGNSKTVFNNNKAITDGGACFTTYSSMSFEGNAITEFSNNTANNAGGACSSSYGSMSFEGSATTMFSDNTAVRGGAIRGNFDTYISLKGNSKTGFSNNAAVWGGAIRAYSDTYISFKGNSKMVFSNNMANIDGGACSTSNSSMSFEGNAITEFSNNTANAGGACSSSYGNMSFEGSATTVFSDNTAVQGGAIHANFYTYISFKGNSKTGFSNNTAVRGGAIRAFSDTYISFKGNSKTVFSNNKANIDGGACFTINSSMYFEGSATTVFSNNTAVWGGAILAFSDTYISFKGNSKIVFSNNTANIEGGACSSRSRNIMSFEGNTTTEFSNNVADYGGAIHAYSDTYIYFKGNSKTVFSNNMANPDGGACYTTNSSMSFEGNAITEFYNNTANNAGGACSSSYGIMSFEGSATTMFSNNTAVWGGAIRANFDNYISFQGNSKTRFSNNTADYGGAIRAYTDNYISFKENSKIVFSKNTANIEGGACSSSIRNNMSFEGNTTAVFSNNTANYGGAVTLYDNCTATIEQLSNITFTDNVASQCGGALHFSHNSNISFLGYSFTLFADNRAESYGGAVCFNVCSGIKFEENSTAIFKYNTAPFGENIYLKGNSVINLASNSSVSVNQNTARWNYHGGQFTYTRNDIIIDANGIVRCSDHVEYYTCQHQECYCENIENISSNSVVIITDNITLSSSIQLTELDNISLIGYNSPSIYCENDGGLQFTSCTNVTITNITWHRQINNDRNLPAKIKFYNSSNITIDHCTFQQSVGQAVVLSEVSGVVNIKHCKFLNNKYIFREHGTAIYYSSSCNDVSEDKLIISNCYFTDNTGIVSLIFLENLNSNSCGVSSILQNSNFSENQFSCIYLSNQNLYIKGNVLFENNEAENGAVIFISDHSNVTFGKSSNVTFAQNTATINGGAIYINNWSSVVYENSAHVMFTSNKATQGGAIYSGTDSSIEFHNNSTAIFNMNEATKNGGCIFTEQSIIEFKGTCSVKFNNSVVFSGAGGAIFCKDNSKITLISGNVIFYNNTVYNGNGGAIYCTNSIAIFQGTSNVEFHSNKATYGGAADFDSSSLKIRNNTIMTFNGNSATVGGAVNFHEISTGILEMNSTLVLKDNRAIQNGGAFYLDLNSYIEFKQYVIAKFDSNNAKRGGAIYLMASTSIYKMYSTIIFKNNIALQDGGAIYIAYQSHLTFMGGSHVTFSHNRASDYGGAIYGEVANNRIINFGNSTKLFLDNRADTAGNSVYINLPTQCNSSCLTNAVLEANMSNLRNYITTSPKKIDLHISKFQYKCSDFVNDTECDIYYIQNIMLGQKILLDACMYDYYNFPVKVARFFISSTDNQSYHLDSNNILIKCNHTLELASIYGNESTQYNYSINISLYDSLITESKEVMAKLLVELSPCHPGFSFHKNLQKCECYNASDIVFCSGSSSTIKRGYWFGSVIGKPTVTFCPINYCNFTCCETSNGYYHLSPVRDNQCRSHRSGTACGSCTDGYTLSYDSTECVNVESCTAGQTVLVILLSITYWIVMVILVFTMMYYKVGIGYLYGITYYYSIVDILLTQNLYTSREIYLTVNILSSFSKIIPQFLGELCLTTGTSGIDQQFIHYIHPSAVIVILGIISLSARISQRISTIISRGIIHVICLLLLLSYTSIASTSLLLLRQLKFDDIDNVYTYLSPDIEYFHDRHLAYGIVALLCIVIIVICLPLLLTLEPFLNRKFNFIKIKPLLDQFQGCYKDKYRCFAGYYMICRLVIITIVITNSSNDFVANYMLIIVCGIIDLIHISVKPYSSEILNKFDSTILHLVIFIAALPLFDDFDSPLVITIAFVLVIIPLLNFLAMTLFLHKDDLKRFAAYFTVKDESFSSNNANNNEIPMKEFDVIVDDSMRKNATICGM